MKKAVIITGASAGLGEELARNYAEDGWQIGLIARRKDAIDQLKNELESKYSVNVIATACDVSNKPAIFSTIESMIESFGRIDCIVANAGVGYSTPGYAPDADKLDQTIGINVLCRNTNYVKAKQWSIGRN